MKNRKILEKNPEKHGNVPEFPPIIPLPIPIPLLIIIDKVSRNVPDS